MLFSNKTELFVHSSDLHQDDSLAKIIDLFYEIHMNNDLSQQVSTNETSRIRNWYQIMTNSQSKELGNVGDNCHDAQNYMLSLNFTGVFDQMEKSKAILKRLLHWPDPYYVDEIISIDRSTGKLKSQSLLKKRKSSKALQNLSDESRRKLEAIQHCDLSLYAEARKNFDRMYRDHVLSR